VALWDMRNYAWALGAGRYLSSGSLAEVENVAFSSDGRHLATASVDQSVRLWNVRTDNQIGGSLDGHAGPVYAVAFSPDGRTLASGSGDHTVRLWDVQSHRQLGPALRTASAVYSVAFSPDGRLLAAAGADGTVSIWRGLLWKNFAELRSRVCGIAAHHLTEGQWAQLVPGLSYGTSCDA
jgi:WD40 repeat protein